MFGLGGQELLIVLLIVLLLFGSARLPRLARSMREAKDEFNKNAKESKTPEAHTDAPTPAPPEDGSSS
jgi:sec-independent protein translocase protein TatA